MLKNLKRGTDHMHTAQPKLTREQAAILSLYTGFLCGPFSDMHELAEKVMGGPIFTHQFADKELVDKMKQAVKPMFLELVPEE